MKERQGHEETSSLYNREGSGVRSRGREEQEQEASERKEGQQTRRDKKSWEQETRRGEEEEASLSLYSRDFSLLSKEVERLQRQIEGMDQDRKVYQAATVKLVRYLHLHLHLYLHLHLHCISLHTAYYCKLLCYRWGFKGLRGTLTDTQFLKEEIMFFFLLLKCCSNKALAPRLRSSLFKNQ